MIYRTQFGKWLKNEQGRGVEWLASRTGTPRCLVSKVCNHYSVDVSLRRANLWAKELGISLDELYNLLYPQTSTPDIDEKELFRNPTRAR